MSDPYLAICAEKGRESDHPYSGRIEPRLDTALHRAAAARAAREGESLNDLVVEAISDRVRGSDREGIAA